MWELFSLFIFSKKEVAIQRLEIIIPDLDNTESKEDQRSEQKSFKKRKLEGLGKLLEEVTYFELEKATCFHPNETIKLRLLMDDLGVQLDIIRHVIKNVILRKIERIEKELDLSYMLSTTAFSGRNDKVYVMAEDTNKESLNDENQEDWDYVA